MQSFERNRTRVKQCPCGKSNSDGKFVPFVGKLKEGYCHSCCKVIKQDHEFGKVTTKKHIMADREVSEMPFSLIRESKLSDDPNYFAAFIYNRFGSEVLSSIVEDYSFGTSSHWNGSTVFWYIDFNLKLRTGKIMLYDPESGKRIKEPRSHISWAHTLQKNMSNKTYKPCLYGEHLSWIYYNKPIAIVESEKTAIISSIYLPNFVWLATGGKGSLSYEKLKVLKNRKIVLFPDLDAYEEWRLNAAELSKWFNISVSEYLFDNTSDAEKSLKYDIADYLLRFELSDFRAN